MERQGCILLNGKTLNHNDRNENIVLHKQLTNVCAKFQQKFLINCYPYGLFYWSEQAENLLGRQEPAEKLVIPTGSFCNPANKVNLE